MPKAHVYGTLRDLPTGFEEFTDRAGSAILSIDMHRGHLEDSRRQQPRLPRHRRRRPRARHRRGDGGRGATSWAPAQP